MNMMKKGTNKVEKKMVEEVSEGGLRGKIKNKKEEKRKRKMVEEVSEGED